ncbi:MAG: TrkH family potassium uptake protein, partial [Bacillota bacterium]
MRWQLVVYNLGRLILIVGLAMLTCLPWSIIDQEAITWELVAAASLTVIIGLLLTRFFKTRDTINIKEVYLIVTLGWVVASVFGALLYMLTGYLPSPADALFETVSGFTTTGSSVVA